tara:strand:+ start:679 stop:1170 length:492 start_codon:yes stop_codon:yes gene_type:complete
MKGLWERLGDYKVMKDAIQEFDNGYCTKFNGLSDVTVGFRELNGHLFVEREFGYGSAGRRMAMRVFELEEVGKAKKFCYDKTLDFLRRNTHVEYGEIWHKNEHPHRGVNEKGQQYTTICSTAIGSWVMNGLTKFGKLGIDEQNRINRERARRGLGPARIKKVA